MFSEDNKLNFVIEQDGISIARFAITKFKAIGDPPDIYPIIVIKVQGKQQ